MYAEHVKKAQEMEIQYVTVFSMISNPINIIIKYRNCKVRLFQSGDYEFLCKSIYGLSGASGMLNINNRLLMQS